MISNLPPHPWNGDGRVTHFFQITCGAGYEHNEQLSLFSNVLDPGLIPSPRSRKLVRRPLIKSSAAARWQSQPNT